MARTRNGPGADGSRARARRPDDEVEPEREIDALSARATAAGMRVLTKTAPATWGDLRGRRSNLDHVVAASHLAFKAFAGAEVDVRGWPELDTKAKQRDWIKAFSDHAVLYFDVQRA